MLLDIGLSIFIVPYLSFLASNMPIQTFCLIKPDAIESTLPILATIESNGFKTRRKKTISLTKHQASLFYKEHEQAVFFNELIEYITSGPVTAMVLEKENAVDSFRHLLGPTDSNQARVHHPSSIRANYGKDKQMNACHGSDSIESATREIDLFFNQANFNVIVDTTETIRFLETNVYPALTKGLDEMLISHPEDPLLFLGEYLMNFSK